MHPLSKYTTLLFLLSLFNIQHSTFAAEDGDPLQIWNLENESTTLASLSKERPLFIALIEDYESPDEPMRFITLVEHPPLSERTDSILCIPIEDTNYLSRKAIATLIKRHIKGDYMSSKLYFANAAEMQQTLQNKTFALLFQDTLLWSSNDCPQSQSVLSDEISDTTSESESIFATDKKR